MRWNECEFGQFSWNKLYTSTFHFIQINFSNIWLLSQVKFFINIKRVARDININLIYKNLVQFDLQYLKSYMKSILLYILFIYKIFFYISNFHIEVVLFQKKRNFIPVASTPSFPQSNSSKFHQNFYFLELAT